MMRGIAILGIFVVNMLSFHSPILYIDPYSTWTSPIDRFTYMLIDVFAQGSFYPLFSFLFGYGFVMLRETSIEKGESFPVIATRRLVFLLLIGWIHANYVWHGDILFTYALFGFFLLLFIKLNGKILILIGSILFLLPNLVLTLLLIVAFLLTGNAEFSIADETKASASYQIYQSGSFTEISKQRFRDWYSVNNPGNMLFMFISIFPMFLIGAGAAKQDWFRRVNEGKRQLQIALGVLLLFGLLIKWSPYMITNTWATEYAQDILGGPLLALSYIIIIALVENLQRGKRFFKVLGSIGRLSFTNYLLQSLISTLIFYSYGLGLYGKISVFEGTILVLVIFLFQLLFSHLWVKSFRLGPFEWVWRMVTYWKIPKMKKMRG